MCENNKNIHGTSSINFQDVEPGCESVAEPSGHNDVVPPGHTPSPSPLPAVLPHSSDGVIGLCTV